MLIWLLVCTRDKRAGFGENDSKDWGQPVLLLLLWYNLIRGKSYVISRDRAIRLEYFDCFCGSNNFDSEIIKTNTNSNAQTLNMVLIEHCTITNDIGYYYTFWLRSLLREQNFYRDGFQFEFIDLFLL